MLDFSVTFVITIINIAVLFFILRAILFKPVTKFMADRTRRIQESIAQAENDKAKAKEQLEEYNAKLKNAEAEAAAIIKAARAKAEAEAESIVAGGRAAAENLIVNFRKQLESERQAMHARFSAEAAALVMAATARLVQHEIAGDDKGRYVKMLLDELAAQKGNG